MKATLDDLVPKRTAAHVVSLNRSPEERKNAVVELQSELEALLAKFAADNPDLPMAFVLGTLRIVEKNFIDQY